MFRANPLFWQIINEEKSKLLQKAKAIQEKINAVSAAPTSDTPITTVNRNPSLPVNYKIILNFHTLVETKYITPSQLEELRVLIDEIRAKHHRYKIHFLGNSEKYIPFINNYSAVIDTDYLASNEYIDTRNSLLALYKDVKKIPWRLVATMSLMHSPLEDYLNNRGYDSESEEEAENTVHTKFLYLNILLFLRACPNAKYRVALTSARELAGKFKLDPDSLIVMDSPVERIPTLSSNPSSHFSASSSSISSTSSATVPLISSAPISSAPSEDNNLKRGREYEVAEDELVGLAKISRLSWGSD